MNEISNSLLISLSRLLERAGYYGLRSVLVLYLVSDVFNLNSAQALTIYSYFTFSLIIFQFFGAIIGDLVLNSKKATIIGGILQAIGALTLTYQSETFMNIGLSLVALGSGFYTPNIIAQFGKNYLNKPKKLDAGFTFFYVIVNLGSLIGVMLISSVEKNYTMAFIISAVLFALATISTAFTKNKVAENTFNNGKIEKSIIVILGLVVLSGLFWGVFEFIATPIYLMLSNYDSELGSNFIEMIRKQNGYYTVSIGLLLVLLWSFIYLKQYWKLILGFIIAIIAIGFLFLIPEAPSEKFKVYFIISSILLVIAELLIAPIALSAIAKYSNPKYLAIIISLIFVSSTLFIKTFNSVQEIFKDFSFTNYYTISIIVFSTVVIGLILSILIKNVIEKSILK